MANTQQRTVTLNGNGQSTPNLNVSDYRTFSVDVSGTFVATVAVQGSVNGTTWRNIPYTNVTTGVTTLGGTFTTSNSLLAVDVSALQFVRLTTTAYTSGSIVLEYFTAETGNLNQTVPATGTTTLGAGTASIGTVTTPSGSAISVTSAASTNASVQKATAGNLFEISVSNPTATPAYVKLYNKASAPTVGTDVPVLTIVAPATSASATQIASANGLTFSQIGKRFTTGIAMAITAGPLATDTAVAVAGVQVHGTYV